MRVACWAGRCSSWCFTYVPVGSAVSPALGHRPFLVQQGRHLRAPRHPLFAARPKEWDLSLRALFMIVIVGIFFL